jgi:hypothetical protein
VLRVAVLADDLIWQTRLVDAVTAAGATAMPVRSLETLQADLPDVDAAIVDLTARRYDPIAAIERVIVAGRRALAVGQHDDQALRRRALDAGAERVYAYRKLFDDGPAALAAWLTAEPRAVGSHSSREG